MIEEEPNKEAHETWEKLVAIKAHCEIISQQMIKPFDLTSYEDMDKVQETLERCLKHIKSIKRG